MANAAPMVAPLLATVVAIVPVIAIRPDTAPTFTVHQIGSAAPCASARDLAVERTDASAFERRITALGVRRVVFFVPGYATSVPLALSAARRLIDTFGPEDMVAVIDWGSAGSHRAYEHDAKAARRAAPAFAALLAAMRRAAPRTKFDVFAHSMGTRVAVNAIAMLTPRASKSRVVEQVVLAAPDMTISDYQRAISRRPEPFGRVTIYASRHDHALLLSSLIHLHRRLGRLRNWRRPLAQTDIVDASVASRGVDGHGYATTDPQLLRDVAQTLAGVSVPHADWGRAKRDSVSWIYAPPGGVPRPRACPRPAIHSDRTPRITR